jgi:hypothetical protein
MGLKMLAAATALMFLCAACALSENKALSDARWNSWPKESIGHHENSPGRFEIAAIIHRGGLRNIHDAAAFHVTVDRFLRYAAGLAKERNAPTFAITEARLMVSTTEFYRGPVITSASTPTFTQRIPFMDGFITLLKEGEVPSDAKAVLRTSDILSAPKETLLTVPAVTELWQFP